MRALQDTEVAQIVPAVLEPLVVLLTYFLEQLVWFWGFGQDGLREDVMPRVGMPGRVQWPHRKEDAWLATSRGRAHSRRLSWPWGRGLKSPPAIFQGV
ncbi:hypothetical protein CapIbe_017848 [Capra ibex]